MNEDTNIILRELAEKLGTNVESLWEVMMRQVWVDVTIHSIFMFVFVSIWVLAFKFIKAKTRVPEEGDENRFPSSEREEGAFIAWLLLGIYSFVPIIEICIAVPVFISAIFNPEYHALKLIFQS